ncbi:MAG: DUF4387 domain-containing protein [Alphaproteobacteria bacterium]
MPRLQEMVRVLRSKNAGPFQVTFDMLFNDAAGFERARASGAFAGDRIARCLRYPANQVSVVFFPPANAIKITVPRAHSSGALGDSDVYGCQQHAPLLDLMID